MPYLCQTHFRTSKSCPQLKNCSKQALLAFIFDEVDQGYADQQAAQENEDSQEAHGPEPKAKTYTNDEYALQRTLVRGSFVTVLRKVRQGWGNEKERELTLQERQDKGKKKGNKHKQEKERETKREMEKKKWEESWRLRLLRFGLSYRLHTKEKRYDRMKCLSKCQRWQEGTHSRHQDS